MEPPSDLGNPAEAAFTDIDRAKEEEVDPQQESSTLLEQAECEVDTTVFADPIDSADIDFTGDDTTVVAEVPGGRDRRSNCRRRCIRGSRCIRPCGR